MAQSRRRAQVSAGAVLLIAVGLIAALASTGGVETPATRPGRFAGYSWFGRVTSVTASWNVPRVLAGSPSDAGVSAWISAQSRTAGGPFIQLGVEAFHAAPWDHYSTYLAFWSDTRRQYLDQPLFDVGPGDRVSASLTLAQGRWLLAIADHTTGATSRFATSEDARGPLGEASWLEEHTRGLGSALLPFPNVTTVVFHDLRVNSRRPPSATLDPRTMRADGHTVTPSPIQRDSFVLREARIAPTR